MLDDGVREHEIEGSGGEGQRHAVGEGEVQVRQPALAAEPDASRLEALRRIDADDEVGLLGEGERHAAAAAAGVEDAAVQNHSRPVEEGQDLGAAVVLEERVVVLGPEA